MIAVILFAWTCALGASAFITALGVPWQYALSHTLSACFVGTTATLILTWLADLAIRRWAAARGLPLR